MESMYCAFAKTAFSELESDEKKKVLRFMNDLYVKGGISLVESEDTYMEIIRFSTECMERRFIISQFMNKL